MFRVVVDDLYKDYRTYPRPVDRLIEAVFHRPRHSVFTALRGVSFAVKSGESIGIIGDNGAGKSTLLKILAGTVSPSRGATQISGRQAALLELGSGFHPEFTGRQNIVLNASLLGLSRDEINEREQGIIDFSELEEYIDRPVRTYSSGMYVRLAFAIATSVDPEVLIIDEALAVGDIAFQRKCIDRMNMFRDQGKTMMFCSHSMYHVSELCDRVMWIDQGEIRSIGSSSDVIAEYEDHCKAKGVIKEAERRLPHQAPSSKDCRILELCLETTDGEPIDTITSLTDVVFQMKVEVLEDGLTPHLGFGLIGSDESICCAVMTNHDGISCGPYNKGEVVIVRLYARDFPIREGSFRLIGCVADKGGLLWYEVKQLWPVNVKVNLGMGLVTFKRDWDIRCDNR